MAKAKKKAAKRVAQKSSGKEKKHPAKPKADGKADDDFPPVPDVPQAPEKKTAPPPDLEPLRKDALEAQAALVQAKAEAERLRQQAREIERVAKEAYARTVAPYREACKKAGIPCEFSGGRSASITERVRFIVEKAEGGIRVMIEGRPETDEIIPTKTLEESVNKAAYAYTERHLGPKKKIGNKGGGLSNRIRRVFLGK